MTDSEYPWRDESLLSDRYWKQELSTNEIAATESVLEATERVGATLTGDPSA